MKLNSCDVDADALQIRVSASQIALIWSINVCIVAPLSKYIQKHHHDKTNIIMITLYWKLVKERNLHILNSNNFLVQNLISSSNFNYILLNQILTSRLKLNFQLQISASKISTSSFNIKLQLQPSNLYSYSLYIHWKKFPRLCQKIRKYLPTFS